MYISCQFIRFLCGSKEVILRTALAVAEAIKGSLLAPSFSEKMAFLSLLGSFSSSLGFAVLVVCWTDDKNDWRKARWNCLHCVMFPWQAAQVWCCPGMWRYALSMPSVCILLAFNETPQQNLGTFHIFREAAKWFPLDRVHTTWGLFVCLFLNKLTNVHFFNSREGVIERSGSAPDYKVEMETEFF